MFSGDQNIQAMQKPSEIIIDSVFRELSDKPSRDHVRLSFTVFSGDQNIQDKQKPSEIIIDSVFRGLKVMNQAEAKREYH